MSYCFLSATLSQMICTLSCLFDEKVVLWPLGDPALLGAF